MGSPAAALPGEIAGFLDSQIGMQTIDLINVSDNIAPNNFFGFGGYLVHQDLPAGNVLFVLGQNPGNHLQEGRFSASGSSQHQIGLSLLKDEIDVLDGIVFDAFRPARKIALRCSIQLAKEISAVDGFNLLAHTSVFVLLSLVDLLDILEGAILDFEGDIEFVFVELLQNFHGFCDDGAVGYRLFVFFLVFQEPVLEANDFGCSVFTGGTQCSQKGCAELLGDFDFLSVVLCERYRKKKEVRVNILSQQYGVCSSKRNIIR